MSKINLVFSSCDDVILYIFSVMVLITVVNWFLRNDVDVVNLLKVHKIENFLGSDFEFCVISLLVMLKY